MAGYSHQTVIFTGSQTSAALDLGTSTLVGIHMPNITGTTMTFTAFNPLDSTYNTVLDTFGTVGTAGGTVSVAMASDSTGYYALLPQLFAGITKLKFFSGSSETASITAVLRNIP